MKLPKPFTIYDLRFTIEKKSSRAVVAGRRACAAGNRKSSIVNRKSQEGIALVITLILLSVTLFMALAFLAISRRERGSVTTATDTATARLAADSALAQVQAQIIANIFSTTNPYNYSLLVSTNFINTNGFISGVSSPTNVSYIHTVTGLPLSAADFEQNVANLFLSPRPPVFVVTNRATGAAEFRFYLDLNRNGIFDDSGSVPDVENGLSGVFVNGTISEIGDPQWVGVLERPDAPHGPNNKFLSRFAFIALPVGNTLDLNYIHNAATTPNNNMPVGSDDGFLRNQGVGTWEINLAAFLADLNTNQWYANPSTAASFYDYEPAIAGGPFAQFAAFDDALALLSYRYNGTYTSLRTPFALFANGGAALQNQPVDIYPTTLLMTNTVAPIYFNNPNNLWAGADNTNHFFDLNADLFDPTKSSNAFTNRLFLASNGNGAGTNVTTYDRYTFYRLLSQLGTDSAPESGKMNLNYDNLDNNGNVIPGMETNLIPWTNSIKFFTYAADRMLRAYSTNWMVENYTFYTNTFGTSVINAFGVTNIPVFVDGRLVYSSAVNRILQLAANMYDATTNHYYDLPPTANTIPLPTVFQPIFSVVGGNVYITNFVELVNTNVLANPVLVLGSGSAVLNALALQPNDLVFGVPLIIGTKKGLPNFNEFALQSGFQLTRKMQAVRTSAPGATPSAYQFNQMFLLSVTNQLGVDCWNSYASNYVRPVNIFVADYMTMTLTNDMGLNFNSAAILSGTNINPVTIWPGYNTIRPNFSFQIPLNTNVASVPVSMYRFNDSAYPNHLSTNLSLPYEVNITGPDGLPYPQPIWGMAMTNNLQVAMIDTTVTPNRIIDYVQLSGPNGLRNLTQEIQSGYDTGNLQGLNGLWLTNRNNQNMPNGLVNQIGASLGLYGFSSDFPDTPQNEEAIDGFRAFYQNLGPIYNVPGEAANNAMAKITNAVQLASPTANTYQRTFWQANDPLVHYLASDLTPPSGNGIFTVSDWPGTLGQLNSRYLPWGGNPLAPSVDAADAHNMALKDPLMSSSDHWDFPTNKFPTVGWLGRVHRGTPWQTVYLKASGVNPSTWGTNWTGDLNMYDATNMVPGKDRLLFDLFTTSPNDNATLGRLSVNQTHLAAWSALLSGIVVPTNSVGGYMIIPPAGSAGVIGDPNSQLGPLVTNINFIRATLTNADGVVGAFEHVGDVLRVPQLTEKSPFLAPYMNSPLTNTFNDEMYEWLPQQTMSLLTVSTTPRYVIYSYGQTLKPAPNGITTDSQFFGMVTNYQVVSEIATRAVVRVNATLIDTNAPLSPTNVVYSTTVEQFNVLPPD